MFPPLKKFLKMHGAGNDFLVVQPQFFGLLNNRSKNQTFNSNQLQLIKSQIVSLCQSHFGVGADGFLVVSLVQQGNYKISVFNSDGTVALMCGNGIRCVAAYLYEFKHTENTFNIATDSGQKQVSVLKKQKKIYSVNINMGTICQFGKLQINQINEQHYLAQYIQHITPYVCNIGNEHIILYLDLHKFNLINTAVAFSQISQYLWKYKMANVNFCLIQSQNNLKIMTYEMGVGLTLACGTGACSSAFVAHRLGFMNSTINVQTNGGKLVICIAAKDQKYQISMIGPAEYVFTGIIWDQMKQVIH